MNASDQERVLPQQRFDWAKSSMARIEPEHRLPLYLTRSFLSHILVWHPASASPMMLHGKNGITSFYLPSVPWRLNAALIKARCVKACGRLLSAWHTPAPIEAATWLGIQFFWKGVASTSQKEHMLKCLSPAVT